MISRKEQLLVHPWRQQRYQHHRQKVDSAKAFVDRAPPSQHVHLLFNSKKWQKEKERLYHIQNENVRLLQKLGEIMNTKRLMDFWPEPRPNFLGKERLFQTTKRTCSFCNQAKAIKTSEANSNDAVSPESEDSTKQNCQIDESN